LYVFFFFSSRRRHTRSLRDWSSDVCSSDLEPRADDRRPAGPQVALDRRRGLAPDRDRPLLRALAPGAQEPAPQIDVRGLDLGERSEERRVGKSVDRGGVGINNKKIERLM